MIDTSGRHPETQELARWLDGSHLQSAGLREVAGRFEHVAYLMIRDFDDGRELTECLRKLVEAKDCAVRHALITPAPAVAPPPTYINTLGGGA